MNYFLSGKAGVAKGQVWQIEGEATLGRDNACDIVLDDYTVSRRHCMLRVENGNLILHDLGSSNATLVNGRPLKEASLGRGDEIALGSAILLVGALEAEGEVSQEGEEEPQTNRVAVGRRGKPPQAQVQAHETVVEGTPRTIEDLAELFDILRALSRASSVNGLLTVLLQRIHERFGLEHAAVILCETTQSAWDIFPANARVAFDARTHLREQVRTVLDSGKPVQVVPPEGEHVRACMLAPIRLPQTTIGVLLVESRPGAKPYGDHELELLMAIAQGAAPYFGVVEKIEQLENENERLISGSAQIGPIVGAHPAISKVRALARNCAASNLSVLLLGETGTGKELIAGLIHELSELRDKPLVTVNCAAIPEELFESELFGHVRGAFTGAHVEKVGLLETCQGGTLFLDEVGDLSLPNQARLLRAIEGKRIRRVGGSNDIEVEFRLVSATNKSLTGGIASGEIRRDFYHRINGVEIQLPALRERRSDIPLLAQHFLTACRERHQHRARSFTHDALEVLKQHPWPGNIRELRNVVERAAVLASRPEIRPEDIVFADDSQDVDSPFPSLAQLEQDHIREALSRARGNVQEAARMLGIGRSTLYRKLEGGGVTE